MDCQRNGPRFPLERVPGRRGAGGGPDHGIVRAALPSAGDIAANHGRHMISPPPPPQPFQLCKRPRRREARWATHTAARSSARAHAAAAKRGACLPSLLCDRLYWNHEVVRIQPRGGRRHRQRRQR